MYLRVPIVSFPFFVTDVKLKDNDSLGCCVCFVKKRILTLCCVLSCLLRLAVVVSIDTRGRNFLGWTMCNVTG